jgi:hypothetical protein
VWTSSIVALATMVRRFYGYGIVAFGTSTDIESVCWNSLECRRVFGYGLLLVGSLSSYQEIVRGAREFVRWTVKTFDRRCW